VVSTRAARPPSSVDNAPVAVNHYENFPVASWLCPPALRPAVVAIYRFARTADDIADEGDAPAEVRRAQLDAFAAALDRAADGSATASAWPDVFGPLAIEIRRHALPLPLLHDLLSAFRQDCGNPLYDDRSALLDYCARSANPIGRLLLHLAGVNERDAVEQSDAVCSALQLINFWQDLSIDLTRGRCYVPRVDAAAHGLDATSLRADSDASRALVADLVRWSRALMLQGAPLVHRLPGRFGWELRLVVHGGLRVADKIEAGGFNALSHRPTVGAADAPLIAWRALVMRRAPATTSAAPAHP